MKKKIIGLLTVTLVLLTVFMSSFAVYAATELKITKQPASVSAFAGEKVKVTVTAKGDGLTYKWYYKNDGQSKYTLIKNKNEKTYAVTMKEALDGRKMYCVVKDKYGKSIKTEVVKLTLKEKAKITKQPSSVIVPAGTKAKITVKATGDGLTYSWYYKNKGQSKYTLIKNKTAATYTVTMKDAIDGRKMYCVVKDKYGNTLKTDVVKLTVGQVATITEQPSSVSAISGTKVKFTVKAIGDGLTYKWYYKNKGQSKYTLIEKKNTATYTVTMKDSLDGRKLYCVVKDKYGTSVKTEVVTLKLGKTAKITAQPASVVAQKGSTAVVTISATGDGLSYNWYYMNKGQSEYTLITSKKDKTYTVTMKDALDGRKMYCVVKDKYGTSVKSKVITLTMGNSAEITKQPSSVEAKCGTKANVTVTAKGDGLTYSWYYRNEGDSKFTLIKDKNDKTYSVTMRGTLNGRELYCVVKDKYGTSVKSDVVILYAEHVYDKGTVAKSATCKEKGEKVYTCTCGEKKTESIAKTNHSLGSWKVVRESTVNTEGLERRYCKNCSYYKDRSIAKLPAKYTITLNLGDGRKEKVGVAEDGKYTLEVPEKVGYNFVSWKDKSGKEFASSGTITANTTVTAVWELDGTDTFAELVERTDASVDTIIITKDITVTGPLYISSETKIYSDGNYTLKRDPKYAGDIFVVGKNREGTISTVLGTQAILNLGGGKGTLTVDGNKDNLKTTVKGSAIFVADSGTANIYDGTAIVNHKKLGNERALTYTSVAGEGTLQKTGGAAVAIFSGTVNMYGGVMSNNVVATEYTIIPDETTGTDVYYEYNGCGGSVFNYGHFNMYGGVISDNEALRGGGIYTARIVYLEEGEISRNLSHTYGGAVSSSSSSNADIHIGTKGENKKILIKDNRSMRAGGAVYSSTTSPIIVYGNADFIGNNSDTSGGALYTAGSLTVRDTYFEGNFCTYSGGAIYHQYSNASYDPRYFTLSDSDFVENHGGLGGAVILSASDTVNELGKGTIATIENCNFTKNQAIKSELSAGNGGAIYATRMSDATISDCTFTENFASGNAGALAIHSGSKIDLPDCTFTRNTAATGGAVYASSESTVKVSNVTFTENSAVLTETGGGGLGGAVYVSLAELTFNNVDMYRNSAALNGGAVCQSNIELNIDSSCEFIGNTAGGHGGAFYLTYRTLEDGTKDGAVLNADSVLFKDNTAQAGGAISARTACQANLNKVQLLGNSATGTGKDAKGGGAIYVGFGGVKLTDVTATDNTSEDFGGAVNSVSSEVVVTGGEYTHNIALNGGAFNATGTSELSLTNTKLNSNEANYVQTGSYNSSLGGGAINISGGTLALDTVVLDGNKSDYYGGAVLASKTAVTIKNSTVKNSQGATGAALYFKNCANNTITDTSVTDNTSTSNGVLYANGGTLDMTRVTATGNTAKSGGVLFASGETTVINVNDSSWTENSATASGGTVYFKDATLNVNNCQIANSSSKLGGAFYSEKGALNVKNTSFKDNYASQNGGAIDIVGTVANVSENTTFTNNKADGHGGAVYVNYVKAVAATETTPAVEAAYGNILVDGGIFDANSAMAGGAVSVRTGGEATFNGSVFTANISEGHDGKADGDADGGGAIYVGYGTVNLNGVTATGNETKETLYVEESETTEGTEGEETQEPEGKLYGFGGFLDGYRAKVYIDGGTYSGNKAPSGGAVYMAGSSNVLSVKNAAFLNNESNYINSDYDNSMGGGAINAVGATLTVNDSTFDGNSTKWYGGAVIASKSTVTFDNVDVTNNSGATGAALLFKNSCTTNIVNSHIYENTSIYNGVVYANGGTLTLENVNAEDNKAASGGVFYISGGSTVATLKNSSFTENTATSGGVVYQANAKVIIDNCQVTENSAKNGGAVYSETGTLEVLGSNLSENSATSNGGVVYAKTNANVALNDSQIENNTASNGGAVYVTENTNATINNTELRGNSAGNHGGAVDAVGSVVTSTGTTIFAENTAKNHGGAVYVVYYDPVGEGAERVFGTFNMTGGTIERNSALGGGAVSIRTGCEATLTDTVLTSNSAEGYAGNNDGDGEGGGAIYVGFGTVTLNNVTANGNEAKATAFTTETGVERLLSFGGVVDAYNATVTVNGGTLSGNKAAAGGAIYSRGNKGMTISGATFAENESTYVQTGTYDNSISGGAVYVSSGTLTVSATTFDGNNTGYYGGAVVASGVTATFDADTVVKNNSGTTGGALIFKDGSNAELTGTTFIGNTAKSNGVVYINNSKVTMNKVTATGNNAKNGGVVYASNINSVIDMTECNFTENTATSGGVAFTENATLNFNDCTVSGNTASSNGGVAYSNKGSAPITFSGCEITNNTASSNGGVVHAEEGSIAVNFIDCEVSENSAKYGGAARVNKGSTLTVTNSVFSENEASVYGGAFFVKEATEFTVTSSEFIENYSKSNGGAIYVERTEMTLTDSAFTENSTDAHGGAVNNLGSVITATGDNTFTSNTAAKHGGAIYLTYIKAVEATETTEAVEGAVGVLNMTDGKFENNSAMAGGAVSIRSGCEATLTDTVITGNTVEGYDGDNDGDGEGGGAIYVGFGTVTLNNVTATGNEAKATAYVNKDNVEKLYSFGGVIDAYKATAVTVNGGTFSGNKAATGGVIFADSSTVEVTGAAFNGNESTYDNTDYDSSCGGGALAVAGGTLTVDSSVFDGNKSDYYGGAIHALSVTATIGNKTEIKNNEGLTGGAAYFSNSSMVTMSDTVITGNTSNFNGVVFVGGSANISNITATENNGKYGGVLYLSGGNSEVTDSVFADNTSSSQGGAVYAKNGTVTFARNTFSGNSSSLGGALYLYNEEVTLTDNEFTSNEATSNGGAVDIAGATVNATGTNKFTSNSAVGHGGAVYVLYIDVEENGVKTRIPGVLNMTDGSFENNTALAGGAVSIRSASEATFENTVFTGNTVEGYKDDNDGDGEGGGVIYVGYGTVTLNNVTATGNEAKATAYVNKDNVEKLYSFGGVVDAFYGTVSINGGTFSGNKAATGGVIFADSSTVVIKDAELKENESTYENTDYDSSCGGGAVATTGGTLTLDGVTLDGNKSDWYGGAVNAVGGTTVSIVNETVFKNNTGATGAAVYFKDSCKVTIDNSSFTDNVASYNSVIYTGSGTLNMTKVTATGNSAVYGGALYVSGSAVATVAESNFENNTATSNGGAIYLKLGTLTVSDSTFKGNTAKQGGTIYATENGKLEVTGSTFDGNTASGNAGAIYVKEAATFAVSETEFTKNTSVSNGGAIYVYRTPLTLTNSTFTENSSQGHGGAINNVGAEITATGENIFTSNTAVNHGGAIYVSYIGKVAATETTPEVPAVPGVVNMTDGSFTGNSAMAGGAVSARTGCEVNFNKTVFTGNTVQGYDGKNDGNGEAGGAIYVGYGSATLTDVTATGNEAKASAYTVDNKEVYYGYGGVINACGATVTVSGGTFSGNIAPSGGVIYALENSSVNVTGANFSSNQSNYDVDVSGYTNSHGGGAINVVKTSLTVSGSTFDGNKAGYYGGTLTANSSAVTINNQSVIKNSDGATGSAMVFIGSSTLDMDNSFITDNVASKSGSGVVYFTGSSKGTLTNVTASGNSNNNGGVIFASGTSSVTVESSEFTSNTAKNNGGVINFTSSGKIEAKDTAFTSNNAVKNGGVIYISGKGTAEITNCTFKSNTSATAGAVSADKGATVTVIGGSFESNSATGNGGAILVADSSDKDTTDDTTDVGEAATTLNLTNVAFTSNTAAGRGGAVSTDDKSPNLVINATGCTFTSNSSTASTAGAVEIMNGNQTDATDPTEIKVVFKNCTFTNNSSVTSTGGAVELRSSSVAKFDGITATGNTAKANGAVIYVTSNYSRVYLTGEITMSDNTSTGGKLVHLYNSKAGYSNPPALYTTYTSDVEWNTTEYICSDFDHDPVVVFGMTQMP